MMEQSNLYCVANKTVPKHYNTKDGVSKNAEWLCIEGVPCIIICKDETKYTLNSFTSSVSREFDVSLDEFNRLFTPIVPDGNNLLHLEKYPYPINCNEFEYRTEVNNFETILKKAFKAKDISVTTKKIFEDKIFQIIQAQGNQYITMKDYFNFINGEKKLSKHERFGQEIFNRNCRWCPPIDITYDEFIKSKSYPAPLGIRPKDFCLPSELMETIKELINQILNFDNFPSDEFNYLKEKFPFVEKINTFCKYCGECLDYKEYNSVYKSSTNFMEICHRDPNVNFIKTNMYWGHCDCNRKQGGYSEKSVMIDGVKLMFLNGVIDEDEFKLLISKINL